MKEILLSIELKPTTVYIAEHPDGLCRVHLSPEADMTAPGGGSAFEEELRAEFVWVERLGIVFSDPSGTFASEDLDKLVLFSSKRMVLVSNSDTPEYRVCEWSELPVV
jgi:hypothetical protein